MLRNCWLYSRKSCCGNSCTVCLFVIDSDSHTRTYTKWPAPAANSVFQIACPEPGAARNMPWLQAKVEQSAKQQP